MFTIFLSISLLWADGDSSEFGDWYLDYAKAIKEVEHQDKPLFILFDTVESAGKMVAASEFMNEQVENALRADYVRMFVDVESENGKRLAEQFGAAEFPRLVVIDRSKDWQVYRRSGTHSADEVLAVLGRFRRSKITGDATFQTSFTQPLTSSYTAAANCKT